jgi:uncharacterized membrane protein
MSKKILKFLWDNFITGITVIIPLGVTVLVVRFIVLKLNNILLNPIVLRLRPYMLQEEHRLFLAKCLIFIISIMLIIFIGLMTRIIAIRRFFSYIEKFLYKLPLVNKIYGIVKQIRDVFLSGKKSGFQRVVLVEYPRKGLYAIGFITTEEKGQLDDSVAGEDCVNVYIPTTPNPTTGVFVLVKKSEVIQTDISVEDALKVIISAGAIVPPHKDKAKVNSAHTAV